jgi:hypothetical protein
MTEAVTKALAERRDRERAAREAAEDLPARVKAFAQRIRASYDTRPVSQALWRRRDPRDAFNSLLEGRAVARRSWAVFSCS